MEHKALEVPDVAIKHQPKFSLEVLNDFPELRNWLKEICRFGKFEDFIFVTDYKEKESIRFQIFSKDHCYAISARLPGFIQTQPFSSKTKEEIMTLEKDNGYLGCIGQCRKPRAGEDWTRGRDLADGKYCEETWNEIVNDILAFEMVKVVRNSSDIDEK